MLKFSQREVMGILNKIFGDLNQKTLDKLKPLVEKINNLEQVYEKLSDADLKEKTKEFQAELKSCHSDEAIQKKLDEILPDAFALVREAAKRTLGQRHFDVQLLGGIALHQGKIAEMKTGEGKTLTATLSVYLNALGGKGVHVVTVNDYLAKRDTQWMGEIYSALGLSCGCLQHDRAFLFKKEGPLDFYGEVNLVEVPRKEAYLADITYGTNNEFGFDYLRDNMALDISACVQRGLNYAIIDEVDSILIDEARTPLIISAPAEEPPSLYYDFARFAHNLKRDKDYVVDEKDRAVLINEEGISKVENWLGVKNIYEASEERGIELVHHLENALKAKELFIRDKDYIVKDGQIIIVDEFTGRLMPGRRYSEGIHQAIEAKEGVEIKRESITMATITFQNYFRLYKKLAGMTGTAATEAEEFHKIYGLDVLVIPTHRPMIRVDLEDQVYKTEEAKFRAIVEEIKIRQSKGQPVLVGTTSIEKNELLSKMLERQGIKHEVLNAKNHEREAAIIAQAGKIGAVTVATNMAGRGVDIVLGGSLPPDPTKDEVKRWEREHQKVCELGGLHVIGSERHESRRIDNQLRGRSGRQGDPGSSQFFVSLEDDLMRLFGSERIKAIMDRLGLPEDQLIHHPLISKSIESAQRKVEAHNFDIRKHLLEYDDVINKQRETIYRRRREVLTSSNLKSLILDAVKGELRRIIEFKTAGESRDWDISGLLKLISAILPLPEDVFSKIKEMKDKELIIKFFSDLGGSLYQKREEEFGEKMKILEKIVVLRAIDNLWVKHLDSIEHLRTGIGLRGYAHQDPLIVFKQESYRLFQKLLSEIETNIAFTIFKVAIREDQFSQSLADQRFSRQPQAALASSSFQAAPLVKKKVGRNDPCPCGAKDPKTGRPIKYKRCHGR